MSVYWVRVLNLCMASDLNIFLRSPCRFSFQVFMANPFLWRSREVGPGTTWLGRDIDPGNHRRDKIGIIKFIKSVGQPNNTQPKPRNNPEAYASIAYVKGVSERIRQTLNRENIKTAFNPLRTLGKVFKNDDVFATYLHSMSLAEYISLKKTAEGGRILSFNVFLDV